ncbi:MAG: hypothetical protein HOQ47_09470 [Streptomyces sp.]|nr:hypothetical protein [Streptomyces sp.]
MTARDYPAERIERYMAALAEADVYALVERRDDRERFARAVMAVADAETDPVYKSGYDTGRMHEGTKTLREAARLLRDGNTNWTDDTAAQTVDEVAEWLEERALVREKSSRPAADATPSKLTARENRLAQLLDTIRAHGGKWTSGSVQQIRRTTGAPAQRGTARRDLAELARRGHLAQHGAGDGGYYTLKRRGGGS